MDQAPPGGAPITGDVTSCAPSTTPHRALAAIVALLVAVAATLALASEPAGATIEQDEARLFELTNQSRAANGLGPLAYDGAATGVARAWAQELANSGNLRHNPNLVAQVDAHVTRDWTRLGENVGYAGSIDSVHNAYMNSAGHRANILGAYNRVGVGAARGGDGRVWTTVVFLQGPAIAAPPPPPAVPASTFSPFPSAQAFASQQFADVLGRPADPGGLAAWTNSLNAGAASPAAMVANLVNSQESAMIVEPVNRLYRAFFKRVPDAAGVQYWVGRLRSGAGLQEIANAFVGSPEFRSTYGSLSDQGFVDLVYRNVLNRGADPAGIAYWVGQLLRGALDRGGVMIGFSESPEYKSGTWSWNDVVQVYIGLLRRSPEPAAITQWTTHLRNGGSLEDVTRTILASAEYRNRF
jgi:uncharacterized protein YkwD